jgi:hypothetical protein
MTTYTSSRASARVVLDWESPEHWSDKQGDCRICHTASFGRDEQGRPCHKSCEEAELGAELAAAVGGAR